MTQPSDILSSARTYITHARQTDSLQALIDVVDRVAKVQSDWAETSHRLTPEGQRLLDDLGLALGLDVEPEQGEDVAWSSPGIGGLRLVIRRDRDERYHWEIQGAVPERALMRNFPMPTLREALKVADEALTSAPDQSVSITARGAFDQADPTPRGERFFRPAHLGHNGDNYWVEVYSLPDGTWTWLLNTRIWGAEAFAPETTDRFASRGDALRDAAGWLQTWHEGAPEWATLEAALIAAAGSE